MKYSVKNDECNVYDNEKGIPIDYELDCTCEEEFQTEPKVKTEKKYNQWSIVNGDCIIPVNNTFKMLESGYYTIDFSNDIGLFFKKKEINTNKIYRLPNEASDIILNDISKFWTLEEQYKKYNRVFRRNYLLYSAPGTGKTSLINLMCEDLINKYNGIVFLIRNDFEFKFYQETIERIRKIEPQRKIITIIEDIDNYISDGTIKTSLDSLILNILDGNMRTDGVVTIATTNFIERIESRYKNRPSRFDRVIEFPLPTPEGRKIFIEKSVCAEDLSKIDIDKWVEKTEGFTIDHLNELIVLFFIFGHSEEESFETVNNMVQRNNSLKNETSINKRDFGFKI